MTSTKQPKWLNSERIPPKSPEPSLSSGEESSTDSFLTDYSEIASEALPKPTFSSPLQSTTVLSAHESILNIRHVLNDYRFKSALKIQKFYKTKKLKTGLTTLINTLQNSNKKFVFESIFWVNTQFKAAMRIQRVWKKYRLKNFSALPSPKRILLARAVSIGGSMKKIQNFIEKVVIRRSASPDKKNFLVKSSKKQSKNKSFCINLIQSELDSQDCKVENSGIDVWNKNGRNNSIDSTWESVNEGSTNVTLVMKRELRVRAKISIKMDAEELSAALNQDLEVEKWKRVKIEGSCIPVLSSKSRFWKAENFDCLKKELICEYKDLIKC